MRHSLWIRNLDDKQIKKFIQSRKKPLLNGLNPNDIAHNVAKSLIGDISNISAYNTLVQSINILHKDICSRY